MNKKYEFTDETVKIDGNILHRIKSLRDFGNVTAGELGGFIEREENLSHSGSAWVSDEAKVYGEAFVSHEAQIYNNAVVCDYARVSWYARVCDDALVCDHAAVYDHADVYNRAKICGNAQVFGRASVYCNAVVSERARAFGDAFVFGNARVFGNAMICGSAEIYGDAQIYDCAIVFENARIYGDANVSNNAEIRSGAHCVTNINYDLEESIRVQTGLIPVNGEIIAYKQVRKDLTSFYDPDFKYEIGKIAEAKDPDDSDKSCASGLHFANANYWNCREDVAKSTFLIARIKLEDIITVQEGKIRCRKAEIIGKYDIKL